MAGRSGADGKATPERIFDETKSVTASAKMHMRKLEAELLFLSETKAVSTEIKDTMSSLVRVMQRLSPKDSPPSENVQIPVPISHVSSIRNVSVPTTQALQTPLKFSVKAEHTGTNYRHLVARAGDDVIVHAWEYNPATAIAYNPRNGTCGRIPASLLIMEVSQPVRDSEICVSEYNNTRHHVAGYLTWKAGDYIRICNWKDYYKSSGTGFNLATMEIGLFAEMLGKLKSINPPFRMG